MPRARHLLSLILIAVAGSLHGAVTVVSTSPADGATGVDPSTREFRVKFSAAVRTDSWTFASTQHGEPLPITDIPKFSQKDTFCVSPIELKPNTRYAVSVNHANFRNFLSAEDPDVPVTPYLVVFTTGPASAQSEQASKPARKSPPVTVLSTSPAKGRQDIDPKTEIIRVRFSRPVDPNDYSFAESDEGEPVKRTGEPRFEDGNAVCVVPVKLQPGTSYAISFNSKTATGFRSAADPNAVVTPYLLTFKTSGKAPSPADRWRKDLAYLASELPKRHKDLFFKLTEDQWKQKVKALDAAIPALSETDILAGLLELTASVGDQHTSIGVFDSEAITTLPLSFHWFSDGIYVVGASEEYKDALGCRVEAVGSTGIGEACEKLSRLFAWDNDSSKKLSAPFFLMFPQFLQATKVIPRADEVMFALKDARGNAKAIKVSAVRPEDEPETLPALDPKTPTPLCRKHLDLPYWAEYVEKGNLVYFQYNRCIDWPEKPIAKMRSEVETLLKEHKDARLVIDLRYNGGGSSPVLDPFINALSENKELNRKGRIFVVIGRRTFSSAILNAARLRTETEATFVGETTGSSPNHFGQVESFRLPNSKLEVTYSTKRFKYMDSDDPIGPDIPAELSFSDYMKGIDPALEAIIGYK